MKKNNAYREPLFDRLFKPEIITLPNAIPSGVPVPARR